MVFCPVGTVGYCCFVALEYHTLLLLYPDIVLGEFSYCCWCWHCFVLLLLLLFCLCLSCCCHRCFSCCCWGFWPKWMFWEARITSAVSCSWPDDEGACSPDHKLSKHFFNQITTKTTFEYHFWYSYPSLIIQCNITVITICCHASKCLPPLATDQLIDLIVIVIAIVIVIVIIIVIINH